MKPLRWAALFVIAAMTGCSSMKPQDFANRRPELHIEEYFAGHTRAWGLFEDRLGTVRREFAVDIAGTWDGRELVLDENFTYSDGETERRVWNITKTGPATYEGRAADVIGTAAGEAAGNALQWSYDMNLKVGGGTWRVRFDDWMFLQPDGVLLNRAHVYRWGVWVGTVSIFFQPQARPAAAG